MEVCTCRECRRLFNYLSGIQICPECAEGLEKKFYEVKNYLYDHPGAGLSQILKSCEIKKAYIMQWVREGRIELEECSELALSCNRCGVAIQGGHLCDKCKRNFLLEWNELEAQSKKQEPAEKRKDETPRMRFRKRYD